MKEVASILQVDQAISLKELTMEDCWSILKHYAFRDSEATIEDTELADIGNQIISKVRYSPLALRIVGSLMGKQRIGVNEWENILRQDILKGTMDVLLLSFQHLPSHLQRCFAYCSLFPKGYAFSMNREELVPLWIAQGFVENINESELTLQEKGRTYIEELISYSFFEIEIKYGRYKMHDLLHDLAEEVSKKYCHRIEEDSSNVPATCIHLSVYRMNNFKKVSKLKNLRSLIVWGSSFNTNKFENKRDIFQNLSKLRALHVQNYSPVQGLSCRHICKLKHLRHLKLQFLGKLSELQLAKLYHLQYLYLGGYPDNEFEACDFRQVFSNLINLRTLKLYNNLFSRVDCWDYYPNLNITELTSLRCLEIFHPNKDDVNGMMSLKNLNLEGSLSIKSLENVKSEASSAEAMLNKKRNLNELSFEWSDTLNSLDLISCEDVLEGLEPHPNLERLSIIRYQGVRVSSWMKNENWLPRLRYLYLFSCGSLKEVPYLPPRLEELCIKECNELMQLPTIGDTIHTLKLERCSKLMPPSISKNSPRLNHLEILRCATNESQLFSDLPLLSNLENLRLDGFSNLETFPNLSPTLTFLYIKDFPKLTSMGSLWHYRSLHALEIECCPMLTGLKGLQYCTSLIWLKIRECPMLMTDESLLVDGDITLRLPRLPRSIEYLQLGGLHRPFPRLLEEELHHLSFLQELRLEGFATLPSLERLYSLKDLQITDCLDVELLPNLPSSLTFLQVRKCPDIELLPDFHLSLTSLAVDNCPKLKVKYEKGGPRHDTLWHIPSVKFS